DRFDIVAKAEGELPPPGAVAPGVAGPQQLMLRSLLADRFKLAVHHETRDMPIYALVLARADGKLGPKIHTSDVDCAALGAARGRGGPSPAPPQPGDRMMCGMRMAPGQIDGGGFPLSQLATTLSPIVQRVVVDHSGLAGNYDYE